MNKIEKQTFILLCLVGMLVVAVFAVVQYSDYSKEISTGESTTLTPSIESSQVIPETNLATSHMVTCGTSEYYADLALIGGMDVITRIVEIKDQIYEDGCNLNIVPGHHIGVTQRQSTRSAGGSNDNEVEVVLYDKDDVSQSADPFNLSVEIYYINLTSNRIWTEVQLDGSLLDMGVYNTKI